MDSLKRLEGLDEELRQIEGGDRLRLLITAELAGMPSAGRELVRITGADPAVKVAARAFLEGLIGLRNLELEQAE